MCQNWRRGSDLETPCLKRAWVLLHSSWGLLSCVTIYRTNTVIQHLHRAASVMTSSVGRLVHHHSCMTVRHCSDVACNWSNSCALSVQSKYWYFFLWVHSAGVLLQHARWSFAQDKKAQKTDARFLEFIVFVGLMQQLESGTCWHSGFSLCLHVDLILSPFPCGQVCASWHWPHVVSAAAWQAGMCCGYTGYKHKFYKQSCCQLFISWSLLFCLQAGNGHGNLCMIPGQETCLACIYM